jgi:hypothetical protein
MIVSKSNVELDLMREAGQIVAVHGALPSFKGYTSIQLRSSRSASEQPSV